MTSSTNGHSVAPGFVDTNTFVYAYAKDHDARSPVARQLVRELTDTGMLRTSMQVLQELFVTLTRKGRSPVSSAEALRYLDHIADSPVVVLDYPDLKRAIDLVQRVSISFWDALIVIAAAKSGAKRLYTEDLNHGQVILGVQVVNPFKTG